MPGCNQGDMRLIVVVIVAAMAVWWLIGLIATWRRRERTKGIG
jgi:hypothetical protein